MDTPTVRFKEAALFWLKLGFVSFGGPAGQIALMHAELVERRRWISETRFLHALNFCMVLPGPEAQQLATYLGWLMHRTLGGVVAGVLFVLPSLLILAGLTWAYLAFGQIGWVAGVFLGIKPAVVAIVIQAAIRVGSRALRNGVLWGLAALSFGATAMLHAPFPLVVLAAALLGLCLGRRWPQVFAAKADKAAAAEVSDPRDTRSPHTQFHTAHAVRVALAGLLLWSAPMVLLWQVCGWQSTYTQMAWFFTKAALLTFGGAYAVLPYVYDAAVTRFAWVTPTQMIDGLALGETTPGPLIMIVAFVGFIAAWHDAGTLLQPLAGALGAALATWFTFLPSFLFILLGGPWVESTRERLSFTAPLTAITAAVVGVMLNLALFFALHVFWPQGDVANPDWMAMLLALAALLALVRFKVPVVRVIAACAAAGVVRQGLGF